MRIYTCCPVDGCGAFQATLSWLKSRGIEPAMEFDEQRGHYFRFRLPGRWTKRQRKAFRAELRQRTERVDDAREALCVPLEEVCEGCGRLDDADEAGEADERAFEELTGLTWPSGAPTLSLPIRGDLRWLGDSADDLPERVSLCPRCAVEYMRDFNRARADESRLLPD